MRELKLVGLSKDGRQLIFVDEAGQEYAAAHDDKLRAALRGDRPRLGQLEIEMDSALRPRDIQARIRSGATPDEVAALAEVPVEKILPYCVPVLAERQHVAELARRSSVRRKNADGPARKLLDVVADRLRSQEIDPDSVTWDAWRRDDGRWGVQASYRSGETDRTAMLVYDAAGRYCIADDDEARWLTGERQSTRRGGQPGGGPGERRLAAVPTGDDVLSNVDEDDDEYGTDDLTAVVRAISDPDTSPPVTAAPDPSPDVHVDADGYPRPDVGLDVAAVGEVDSRQPEAESAAAPPEAATPSTASADASSGPSDRAESSPPEPAPVATGQAEPTAERKRRSPKRPSVPSWDEIMLGGGGADDEDVR